MQTGGRIGRHIPNRWLSSNTAQVFAESDRARADFHLSNTVNGAQLVPIKDRFRFAAHGPMQSDYDMKAYWRGSQAVVTFPVRIPGEFSMYVSAKDASDLDSFKKEFGMELSWH